MGFREYIRKREGKKEESVDYAHNVERYMAENQIDAGQDSTVTLGYGSNASSRGDDAPSVLTSESTSGDVEDVHEPGPRPTRLWRVWNG